MRRTELGLLAGCVAICSCGARADAGSVDAGVAAAPASPEQVRALRRTLREVRPKALAAFATAKKVSSPLAVANDAPTCASDGDCASDSYCTTGNTCATKEKNGAACAEGRSCEKGLCVDGVCCESACSGQCEACSESGTAGTCVPVAGVPRGKRVPCAGDPAMCGGSCDGSNASACKLAPSTKSGGSTCAAGQYTPSTCDGLGACAARTVRACSPFICGDDKHCATTCMTDPQCAFGFRCAIGNCVPATSAPKCSDDQSCGVDESGGCGCETGPRPGTWSFAAISCALLMVMRRRRAP